MLARRVGCGLSCLSSFAVPANSFGIILWNPMALAVCKSEVELGGNVALFRARP